jgi:hypothetical protein
VNQIAQRLRDLKWSARIDALPTLNAAANLIEKVAALHKPGAVVTMPHYDDGSGAWTERSFRRCSCGADACPTARLLHPEAS